MERAFGPGPINNIALYLLRVAEPAGFRPAEDGWPAGRR